jgi:VWFA-related protein
MMRKLAFLLLLVGIALPAFAVKPVTVEQLERMLASAQSKPDAEVARLLSDLELTERLNSARLKQLQTNLPGERSQLALIALADTSAFLDLPSTDIPATATPDLATQRRMMSMTVDYLGKTLPLLPNLFAARDTLRFETRPSQFQDAGDDTLHAAGKSRVTVLYRDGREFVDAGADKDKKAQAPDKGLTTWGEFGPIMGTVVMDAARSRMVWRRWELGAGGPQAVFHYSVPKEKSHYDVRLCCIAESYGFEINVLSQRVGYHGEITVDPDSGTILRLTLLADVEPGNPIGEAAIAVEYGPVEIGGKTYFCPVRGIALAQSPDLKALRSALPPPSIPGSSATLPTLKNASLSVLAQSPRQTLLNDVAFREFHLFRSDSRVITGNEPEAASHPSAPPLTVSTTPETTPSAAPPKLAEETAVDSSTIFSKPSGATATAMAAPSAGMVADLPSEPVIPEITVTNATGLPSAPALPESGADSAVTLRLTARLVDVPLVALDKKGRPITNLKPEDLEIYDEGRKVDIRSFVQAGGGQVSPPAPGASSAPDVPHAYSNHTVAPVKTASHDQQGNSIILLIDNNLSFDDLSNVREQMIRFLNGLHQNENVALYIMRTGGVQILRDATTDHDLIAKTLANWTPNAQNISLGQEQEARNRQTMEYVGGVEDLLSVNGHSESDSELNLMPLGAQLRELGDNPGRDALFTLALLARQLASIPGHKSLVWIASDNVLADWNNASPNIDKGARITDSSVLRAQEAMNDAHVSVYPLDASRLEAGGVDASIGNRNVELNPVVPTDPRIIASQTGPELRAGADVNIDQGHDLHPGRAFAQMLQDLHPIQGAYRELADATGGRVFRRASDIVSEFNSVAADGRATYLLSFTPSQAADGKYHLIKITVAGRKDVNLRYRSGFFYREEATTIKDRFRDAIFQPEDATEIALTADPLPESNGRTFKLGIAATDLEIAQKDTFWTDKLDIYLVQREVTGTKANVTGQTLGLRLKPATYQQYLRDGIPFNQVVEPARGVGSVRIVVVDENSGRMGSVTVPAAALPANH